MKKSAIIFAVVGLIGAPAFAADLPVKASPPAPPAAPAWTGFYVGASAGYGWSQQDVLISPLPDPLFGLPAFTANLVTHGFIGGAQAGYNFQSGSFVGGIEADFSGSDIRGNTTVNIISFAGIQPISQKLDWFGTLRLRAGFTPIQNLLLYATGGLAYGHTNYSSDEIYVPVQYPSSGSSTNAGWTVGGGAEWLFTRNWSAKVEYLFYDLGHHTLTALPVPALPPFFVTSRFDNTGNIVRAGVNYHF